MPRFIPKLKPSGLGLLAIGLLALGLGFLRRHGAADVDGPAAIGFALAIVIEPRA